MHQNIPYDAEHAHNRMQSMTQKPTDDNDENTQEEHHDETYQYDQQKSNNTISKRRMQIFVANESEQRSF